MTNIRQETPVSDRLGIKVNRYNSWQNRLKRSVGIGPFITPNANCKSTSLNLAEHTFGCGFLSASVRRWDDNLKQYKPWEVVTDMNHNLLTNGGRDFFHNQCYGTTALGSNGTNYVAVTATAVTPATSDTTLTSELTTLGFIRAVGAYAHTAGTNATTITITYTASGTQNNVQASALFTAATVGTMSHEATFTSTNFVNGDQLGLTWTLNLG